MWTSAWPLASGPQMLKMWLWSWQCSGQAKAVSVVNSLILGSRGNTWEGQHKCVGQGSPLGMRGTALSLAKSRILLGNIRKRAWNPQRNGLRREGETERKRQRCWLYGDLEVTHYDWTIGMVLSWRRDGQEQSPSKDAVLHPFLNNFTSLVSFASF